MNNTKAIKVISIFCILGIIILMFIFFSEIYKTKDYIKTDAIITANIENTDLGLTNDSKATKYKYVEVKYDNYINKYRVWTFLMKDEGSSTTIYYSKDNPNLIRDKFKDWIWKDIDRRERLTKIYNDNFNNIISCIL